MKYLTLFILFTSLPFISGISFAKDTTNVHTVNSPFEVMPFALPKAEPALYRNYRKDWHRLTGFEYSGLHWQQFVAIYVNKGVDIYRDNYLAYLSLYREDEDEDDEDEDEDTSHTFREYELGTIFLKENYLADSGQPGLPSSLTMMIKREAGYDDKNGNWEYLQTDIKGNVIMQGDANNPVIKQVCSGCHMNMAERDYIFSTFLTSKPSH